MPTSYAHYGIPYSGESRLVDCQGNALSTSGLKEFRFIMQSVDGRTISFKEIGHLSSSVTCPLVSFGRLFKNGWRIGGSSNDPILEHSGSGVAVAMNFRNESFVVPGFIRRLAHVNAVSVKVPSTWTALNPGWRHSTSKGLPLCRINGTRYFDASKFRISSSSSSSPSTGASNPVSHEPSRINQPRREGPIIEEVAESGAIDTDVVMPHQQSAQENAPVDEQPQDQRREMQRPEIPDAAEQHVSVRVDWIALK